MVCGIILLAGLENKMHNKKAVSKPLNELIGWGLGILFVAIIIVVLFHQGLLDKLGKAIVASEKYLPEKRQDYVEIEKPKSLKFAESIADGISRHKEGKDCIIEISDEIKKTGNDKIRVENSNKRIFILHNLGKVKQGQRQQRLQIKLEEKVCLLNVVPFYWCYLDRTGSLSYSCDEPMELKLDDFDLQKDNIAGYIYKTKNGVPCMFQVSGDLFGSCDDPRDKNNDGFMELDDDCIDKDEFKKIKKC